MIYQIEAEPEKGEMVDYFYDYVTDDIFMLRQILGPPGKFDTITGTLTSKNTPIFYQRTIKLTSTSPKNQSFRMTPLPSNRDTENRLVLYEVRGFRFWELMASSGSLVRTKADKHYYKNIIEVKVLKGRVVVFVEE